MADQFAGLFNWVVCELFGVGEGCESYLIDTSGLRRHPPRELY